MPVSLREGGDVVIVNYAHSGQVVHQYSGRWGSDYGGQGWKPNWRGDQLTKAGKVFIMAPYLTKLDRMEFGPEDKVIWYKSWGEVLAELVSRHGTGTKVGVYPYPSLQIPI